MEELDNRFFNHGNMKEVNISSEMREDFLSYSMSVIIDRALPDVKDGMKPVHRRVIWAMYDAGFTPDKQHVKSANIVGEVMGKYHPHGDTAIYDTMVRMAQPFSYRYPLVDGHGNFGSLDGDGAAAMRYTEARMSKISLELVSDIKKETIDWRDNYDARHKEPVVLPSRFPNLLVNGSMGIAVGMATNMPTHNLGESIDAIIAVMENPDISVVDLMNIIPGPDFPTGGYIVGRGGIKSAYETGKGSIIMRSKVLVEDLPGNKHKLVIKEIPYLVNKQVMYDKIHELAKEKVIEGISDMKDLSNDRNGIRIEIELKKDVQAEVVLNQLYKLTPVQSSFGVNNNVLVNNVPMLLSLKEIINLYVDHQIDVIKRRTAYDLREDEKRAHILEGLKIALDNIDRIVEIIKTSRTDEEILAKFNDEFGIDDKQGEAILSMQLRRLSGLSYEKICTELDELYKEIIDLKDILANHSRVLDIIKTELTVIKDKYNDPRRTEIIDGEIDVDDEDLISVDDVIISLSSNGYIKRLPVNTYKTQNRGGRGIKGMTLNEDDIIDQNITMSTHDHLLLFTNKGKVYRVKGYKIPESSRNGKGIPVINIINIEKDEKVTALVPINREWEIKGYLFFVTKNGLCKRVEAKEFESIRQSGKIAITMKDDDELVTVKPTLGDEEIIIAASNGKAVRFDERGVRAMGRNASGVRGMNVDGSTVIGACTSKEGAQILVVSKYGYGKKTPVEEYRITSRGAKGVKTININESNGELVALKAVNGDEDALIMRNDGVIIRISLSNVSTLGRVTKGVRLIKPEENTYVKTVTLMDHQDEESEEEGE
ncbi:MAG: DNA gyrase subunit A [Solobacterium sp.]|nr:DNA gyrase subunit A [Solobacterium sp.]MCI6846349.1 DNA gyrase subunit A [Solobacterium sp.]MDD7776703.1 DNA gyrase subunit A [Solobacterium sp.]MDY2953207.1 DNA gyrase subunit A [Erysipelotrichaceae bacterium]MDY4791881.1 DNA gyrase subunit A [Erysipelotrichaceae bacterium]